MFGWKQPAAPAIIVTTIAPGEQSALDCSWCAAEQGKASTDSPDICTYHSSLMIQQSQERQAARQARP
jgi:hypothetical protein